MIRRLTRELMQRLEAYTNGEPPSDPEQLLVALCDRLDRLLIVWAEMTSLQAPVAAAAKERLEQVCQGIDAVSRRQREMTARLDRLEGKVRGPGPKDLLRRMEASPENVTTLESALVRMRRELRAGAKKTLVKK